MGTFAAILVLSFRYPKSSAARGNLLGSSIQVLVPSMLPLATTGGIDYAAHGGGALAGGAVALLMLKLWPDDAPLPKQPTLAGTIAGLGALVTLASVGMVAHDYPRFLKLRGLIPQAEVPKGDPDSRARSAALVARYPDDPRAHVERAIALIQARDPIGGERELAIALTQADALRFYLGNAYANTVHVLLASLQLDLGRVAEAKLTAKTACDAVGSDQPPAPMLKLLVGHHLCE
jgi:rhomboid protease GluP